MSFPPPPPIPAVPPYTPPGDLTEYQYHSQFCMDAIGIVINVGGVPFDVDNQVMTVTAWQLPQPGTQMPPPVMPTWGHLATRTAVGVYEYVFNTGDSMTQGYFQLDWAFDLDGQPETTSTFIQFGAPSPAYDALNPDFRGIIEDVWVKFCVDEKTEILTQSGWKTVHKILPGDQTYTRGKDGIGRWEDIEKVTILPVRDEPMLSVETMVHSSLTTLWHKWPTLHTSRRTFVEGGKRTSQVIGAVPAWRLSSELNSNDQILTAAPYGDGPLEPKYTDAFVELIGWLWTEGSIITKPTGTQLLTLAQSMAVNPDKVVRIRRCLSHHWGGSRHSDRKRYESAPSYLESDDSERDGMIRFYLNAKASEKFLEVMPNKVLDLEFLRMLTPAQLELLIETSIAADGCIATQGSWVISQSDKQRLDAFGVACILAGYTPRTRYTPCRYKGELRDQWTMTIRRKSSVYFPNEAREGVSVSTVPYTGIVWCPTTASHTWLARREGTVYFTGNCDGYDSPQGGPNLQMWYQTHFNRGRLAQLLRQAIQHLNVMGQPTTNYSSDGSTGALFPLPGWQGLVNSALTVEVLKHLMRAYVEDPEIQGAVQARMIRRDYMSRWASMLEVEEAEYKLQRDVWRIKMMFRMTPRVLVSGGAYGTYSPVRMIGNLAARPAMWWRFY
jgi:hypothetical protein